MSFVRQLFALMKESFKISREIRKEDRETIKKMERKGEIIDRKIWL